MVPVVLFPIRKLSLAAFFLPSAVRFVNGWWRMSIFTHSSPLEDLQPWISLRGLDFYSAHKEGEVDPAATQGSVLWWLVGVWLACNAIVPVALPGQHGG